MTSVDREQARAGTGIADKRVLMVGGATGIGRATLELLVQGGARVAVGDISDQILEWSDEDGAFPFVVDVRDEEGLTTFCDFARRQLRGFDALIYVAGLQRAGSVGPLDGQIQLTSQGWDDMMSVNARGAFTLTSLARPFLATGSSIVYVASIAGIRGGGPGLSAYSASKGALIAFAKSLADELSPEIRVNVVCPGWTDTPFNRPTIEYMERAGLSQDDLVTATVPLQRQARPEEQAPAIVFLVSEASSYITGHTLVVDGGLTLV